MAAVTEVVAEISGNHGGKQENALRLIEAAKAAGADAVKFQCFDPYCLAKKRVGVLWDNGKALTFNECLQLYSKTYTPHIWFYGLIRRAKELSIPWFSSVFDPDDVTFLETLDCPRYKISAYEMLDGDLIKAVVRTGKPIVMSVRPQPRLTVLIASNYGTHSNNLGLSDHTQNNLLSIAFSSADNTPMIERHIRLPDVETPDAEFSSTPEEFAAYVQAIRKAAA